MINEIHLGYQIPTGQAVTIPLHHTVVTGVTQKAGKTTTIEALLSRMPAGFTGLVFRTKRREITFDNAHGVQAYYRPPLNDVGVLDWQYVQQLLENAMKRKMNIQESFIIDAAESAHSLQEFHHNIQEGRRKATRGFDQSIYTSLDAYMKIVIPQLEDNPFSEVLELRPGLNVMQLGHLSEEVQSLVIASSLREIHRNLEQVITVIPEAAKFLPQARSNPVKLPAQSLVREGGASNLWLWLDSQDITRIDKEPLKSVGVWIMGVQNEINEVKRVIDQLPTRVKPKPEEIMSLQLGNFWVAAEGQCKEVYVQPAWMSEEDARAVSTGNKQLQDVFEEQPRRVVAQQFRDVVVGALDQEASKVYEEALAEAHREISDLKELLASTETERDEALGEKAFISGQYESANGKLQGLMETQEDLMAKLTNYQMLENGLRAMFQTFAADLGYIGGLVNAPQNYAQLTTEDIDLLALEVAARLGHPTHRAANMAEKLKYDYQVETVERLAQDLENLDGKLRRSLIWLTVNEKPATFKAVCEGLGFPLAGNSYIQWSSGMNGLVSRGWIQKDRHGLQSRIKDKVSTSLAAYDPDIGTIDETYNYLLAKLADEEKVFDHA